MGSKLGWIRDCWSLFVSNLSPTVTTKILFDVFREAGPVFDVFLPKDRASGKGRGFGFVRYKTEWDVNRAIQRFDGSLVVGRRIRVQKARVTDRNAKKFGQVKPAPEKKDHLVVIDFNRREGSMADLFKLRKAQKGIDQVWIEGEGDCTVVKLAASLASSLRKEVENSFVATVYCLDVNENAIQDWLFSKRGIQAEVKRLNSTLLWIMPTSQEDFLRMLRLDCYLNDSVIRRLDRWTEVLGPVLKPSWIEMEGIPLHAWDERVFSRLGECLGVVLEIDEEAKKKMRIDRVRILILRDPQRLLPPKLDLEVDGVRFCIGISIAEMGRSSKNIQVPEISCRSPKFLDPDSETPQVQGDGRFEVAKIQPNISADLKLFFKYSSYFCTS